MASRKVGNQAERILAWQAEADGYHGAVQNHIFSRARGFEIDLAWPQYRVGVEIDGGVFNRKAHGSVTGILRDMEKHNLIVMEGWRVLRFTPAQVKAGEAIRAVGVLLRSRGMIASQAPAKAAFEILRSASSAS